MFQDLEERDSIGAETNEPVGFWCVGAVVKMFAWGSMRVLVLDWVRIMYE